MEVLKSFLIIIVVVLSFGVAVIAGQNGLLSARCAARCLTEHKDRLRGGPDRNNHRKFKLLDRCKYDTLCFMCMKPCTMQARDIQERKCSDFCETGERECIKSCQFMYYIHTVKAGDCPSPESAIGFEAVCLASCKVDGDCVDNKKCCPNMCGYTCRKPVYVGYNLPPVPSNVSLEERRKGKSLYVTWTSPGTQRTVPSVGIYLVEFRNTTNQQPIFDDGSPWTILSVTRSTNIFIQQIHAGHWYQFRVAMVTDSGTQGFSSISSPFKSSRRVQKPLPPQNITEGVTTLRKGHVDLTIHWQPPKYSDIPVWKYLITWSERLASISPVFIRIPVLEKTVLGNVHEFKLKRLKPGTTYHIQLQAIVRHGNRELRSNKLSSLITTYLPPHIQNNKRAAMKGVHGTVKDDNSFDKEDVISVYKDIITVEELQVVDGLSYFDKGSLKATLTWTVGEDFRSIVKSYMIYWEPQDCLVHEEIPSLYEATSHVTQFEVYDLQYECVYTIKVNAVTKAGVQGKPTAIRLRTPRCDKILVKGDSLSPECPVREPQVPNSPRRFRPYVIKDNCSITINLTWKHPRSDSPIESYLIEYEVTENFRARALNTEGTVYKPKPIQIDLDKVRSHTINNLKQSESYLIKLYAISQVGRSKPAFAEILTPRIFPCGSDKDPEPPDKSSSPTHPALPATTVFSPQEVSTVQEGTTVTVSMTTTSVNKAPANSMSQRPNINIYKTVYYLAIFIYKFITS